MKKNSCWKRLFTTATPRYFSKNVVGAAESEVEIVGMDDEVTFGPVVHRLTFGQAVVGASATIQVVVVGVTEPMVRVIRGQKFYQRRLAVLMQEP